MVRPWKADELRDPQKLQRLLEYDQAVKLQIDGGDPSQVPGLLDRNNRTIDVYDGTDDVPDPVEPEAVQDKDDDYTDKAYEQLISAQVMLPLGEVSVQAQVVGRKRDANGNPIGTANRNSILDTHLYEVRFEDGSSKEYAANAIAENLYSQVDPEGNEFLLLDEIVKFRKKANAVSRKDMYLDDAKRQP
jgi:hypothetical protein